MWPFKKKSVYKITWAYGSEYARNVEVYTEFIRATDVADAWRKHRRTRSLPTYCVGVEVVSDGSNNSFIS